MWNFPFCNVIALPGVTHQILQMFNTRYNTRYLVHAHALLIGTDRKRNVSEGGAAARTNFSADAASVYAGPVQSVKLWGTLQPFLHYLVSHNTGLAEEPLGNCSAHFQPKCLATSA